MSAPLANMAAEPPERGVIAVASASPVSAGRPMSLADAACTVMYDATALAKMVLSRETPMEPPSCWPTVTVADATPASRGATPNVPVLMDGAITMPTPGSG